MDARLSFCLSPVASAMERAAQLAQVSADVLATCQDAGNEEGVKEWSEFLNEMIAVVHRCKDAGLAAFHKADSGIEVVGANQAPRLHR